MKSLAVVALTCLTLAACAEGRQRSPETRSLDSGVTESSGGGQSVLHNQPNIGTGAQQGGREGRNPNALGNYN